MLNTVLINHDFIVISLTRTHLMARIIIPDANDVYVNRTIDGYDDLYQAKLKDIHTWALEFYKDIKEQQGRS